MAEFTLRAVLLGAVMAVILGAANAYIGMVAGLTIAATFPAAVVAMALLRPMAGTILEENVARTTASVGEALVAGAIFTIPAFVIAGVWEEVNILISGIIMVIGGMLGVFFVIILRRTLVEDAGLPFPESVAASEIHKAGQKGATGGKYLVIAGLTAALLELLKNASGIRVLGSTMGCGSHRPGPDSGQRVRRRHSSLDSSGIAGAAGRRVHHRSEAGGGGVRRWRAGLVVPGTGDGVRQP
jgi:putative OPT family oligopeptide transporter